MSPDIQDIDLSTGCRLPLIGVASGPHTDSAQNLARCFGITDIGEDGALTMNPEAPLYAADLASLKTIDGVDVETGGASGRTEPVAANIAVLGNGVVLNSQSSFPRSFTEYVENLLMVALKMGKPLFISVGYEAGPIRHVITRIKEYLDIFKRDNGYLPEIIFELSLHHGEETAIADRIKAAVEASKPYDLFVKISYYDGYFREIAELAVQNGAKGLIGINSLGPVDSQGMLAMNPQGDAKGWVSGSAEVAQISLEIARQVIDEVCVPHGIPYIAVGGVTPETIMQFLERGAVLIKNGVGFSVEVCSLLLQRGVERGLYELRQAVRKAIHEAGCASLTEYLERHVDSDLPKFDGFPEAFGRMQATVAEELGRARTRMEAVGAQLPGNQADIIGENASVSIDPNRCRADRGCDFCEVTCPSSAVEILRDESGNPTRAGEIDTSSCVKCGACICRCPESAIELVAAL